MGLKIEIPIKNYTVEIGYHMTSYGPPINARILCEGQTSEPNEIKGTIEI